MSEKVDLFILSGIISILLHEEIMLLIQIIAGIVQTLSEPLEVNDFSLSQEAHWRQHFGVICHIDQVLISAPCLLFCCTFVSVMCYVKQNDDSTVLSVKNNILTDTLICYNMCIYTNGGMYEI